MIAALYVQTTLPQRLAKRLRHDEKTGCHLWTGSLNNKGYGQISVTPGRPGFTHRVSWEIKNGKIPEGLCVLHKCDTPACCNPDHLFLGTKADNNKDMRDKGRARYSAPKGERNGLSKLNKAAVEAIRASTETGPVLAKRFGVCRSTISQVRRRVIW